MKKITYQPETLLCVQGNRLYISQDLEGTFDVDTHDFSRAGALALVAAVTELLADPSWDPVAPPPSTSQDSKPPE